MKIVDNFICKILKVKHLTDEIPDINQYKNLLEQQDIKKVQEYKKKYDEYRQGLKNGDSDKQLFNYLVENKKYCIDNGPESSYNFLKHITGIIENDKNPEEEKVSFIADKINNRYYEDTIKNHIIICVLTIIFFLISFFIPVFLSLILLIKLTSYFTDDTFACLLFALILIFILLPIILCLIFQTIFYFDNFKTIDNLEKIKEDINNITSNNLSSSNEYSYLNSSNFLFCNK